MGTKKRLGVLGSGKGSNCAAILEAIREDRLSAEIAVVIADQPGAGILDLAAAANIPAHLLTEPRYRTRWSPEVEAQAVTLMQEAAVDLVVLAGFMRVVKEPLLTAYPGRIINIHPSLLPKYRGLAAWKQALEAGDTVAGCTVHYVDCGVDTGTIIAQAEVPILPNDTPETLHARIQKAEHDLYPRVIGQLVASA